MAFEQHQEKKYPKDAQSIFQAALQVTEKFEGKVISSAPQKFSFTARFPKTILGQTLGERTELACTVSAEGNVVVDAFQLDAVERKLMFGARKGVTITGNIVRRPSGTQPRNTTGAINNAQQSVLF